MKPVYQTIFSPPNGNCLQAAISSIFELSLDEVPNFVSMGDHWFDALDEFTRAYGVYPLIIDTSEDWTPKGWHLTDGPSTRGPYWHTLVSFEGKPVHDPYEHGDCKLAEYSQWTLFVALLDGGDDVEHT